MVLESDVRRSWLSRRGVGAFLCLVALAACGGHAAQTGAAPKKAPVYPAVALGTYPLAGEAVSVVPLTMMFFEAPAEAPPELAERIRSLEWADSIIGRALEDRGPEVKWVLPPALRKMAIRSPGVASDPDRMGQAIMREHELKITPDPLRSSLRSMAAISGGRHALIPAALIFFSVPDSGLRAELSMVMTDTRTGGVVYRTVAAGTGSTPARALSAAMATVLPLETDKR